MPTYDPKDGSAVMIEPEITINGTSLSFAQAMTVRVALNNFGMWCEAEGKTLGELGTNYRACIGEIFALMTINGTTTQATRTIPKAENSRCLALTPWEDPPINPRGRCALPASHDGDHSLIPPTGTSWAPDDQ